MMQCVLSNESGKLACTLYCFGIHLFCLQILMKESNYNVEQNKSHLKTIINSAHLHFMAMPIDLKIVEIKLLVGPYKSHVELQRTDKKFDSLASVSA